MNSVLIIIDSRDQWAPYYQTESVLTALEYLRSECHQDHSHLVINLCSDMSYNSEGYYCSLLAQARKHKVIPTIDVLNRLENGSPVKLDSSLIRLCKCQNPPSTEPEDGGLSLDLYFGNCEDAKLERLARFIYDQYPAPLLQVSISANDPSRIVKIRRLSLDELSDHQQDLFANNLDRFNKKVWRMPREKKPARFDLAIYHDPAESLPPSNKTALNLFISEAKKMNINAELITENDSSRLMEFDALFIRQTTAVNHITYQLAQRAWQADMVVIDDPASIVRCTNKVFLKELLDHMGIPAPCSRLLFKRKIPDYREIAAELGSTFIIKIPDGSFSLGVCKVKDEGEYLALLESLFLQSSILLAQEYLPTDFDWRIGVLDGECIYACKYFMARGHWQIYHHKAGSSTQSGRVETVPVHLVPKKVTRTAVKVANGIGKGFYGVDIKLIKNTAVVIEVNDNPSIDHGVEDKILGNELYRMILREFSRRIELKRRF